jgi:hypothetical protein
MSCISIDRSVMAIKQRRHVGHAVCHTQACALQNHLVAAVQEGKALVDFPKDFVAQVHTLFGQWARRYDTLQDWAGPRKYEETPAGQLLKHESDDPKVGAPVVLRKPL